MVDPDEPGLDQACPLLTSTMRRAALAFAPLCLLALACSDGGTGADSGGEYVATLAAPDGAVDGAAVVELTGAGITAVSAVDGALFTARDGNTVRVVVVKDAPGTISFRLTVERGRNLPQARVVEVSDANDDLRASVASYAVRFSR